MHIWSLVMFFKFSNSTRLRLVQFWVVEKHHSCPYMLRNPLEFTRFSVQTAVLAYVTCVLSAWQERDCFSIVKRPYALGGYNLTIRAMYTKLTLFSCCALEEGNRIRGAVALHLHWSIYLTLLFLKGRGAGGSPSRKGRGCICHTSLALTFCLWGHCDSLSKL